MFCSFVLVFFFSFSMWHLEKHLKKKKTLNKKNQTTENKTTASTENEKTKKSTTKETVAAQGLRECTCDHDWPIIHGYDIQGKKTLQSQHLHETWRQVSCNRFLALLHDAIMSHCELRVDVNLRMGDFSPLSCHYVNFNPSSARDCGGFDWPWLGCWNLVEWQKKKRFIYIYLYMEREREGGQESVGRGQGGVGRAGLERGEGQGEGWG